MAAQDRGAGVTASPPDAGTPAAGPAPDAGTPPDVADAHHGRVRDLGASGTIQDLARFLKRDPYPKEHLGWDAYQWKGKQFGIAWGLSSTCLFYNTALFAQAGVPAPPDTWTWDQFLDAARPQSLRSRLGQLFGPPERGFSQRELAPGPAPEVQGVANLSSASGPE